MLRRINAHHQPVQQRPGHHPEAHLYRAQLAARAEIEGHRSGDGILLKPVEPFPHTSLEEVAGCLKYSGPAKSLRGKNIS